MDGEDSVVSTLEQQQEEFRHFQSLSQRFLQVLLATLAITFVFARQEWIDFFLNSEVPRRGLGLTCPSGASISGLGATMVLNSGEILQALVVIGLACLAFAGVWAARILFIDSPIYVPELGRMQVPANDSKLQKAKRLLREAHRTVGLGIGLLVLAGVGYWAFYLMGDMYIVYFNGLAIVVTMYLIWRFLPDPTIPNLKRIYRERIRPAGFLLNAAALTITASYVLFVVVNAFHVISIWLFFLLRFCPNSLL